MNSLISVYVYYFAISFLCLTCVVLTVVNLQMDAALRTHKQAEPPAVAEFKGAMIELSEKVLGGDRSRRRAFSKR